MGTGVGATFNSLEIILREECQVRERQKEREERETKECGEGIEIMKWPIMTNFQINVTGGEGRDALETSSLAPEKGGGRRTCQVACQAGLSLGYVPTSSPTSPFYQLLLPALFCHTLLQLLLERRLHLASFNDCSHVLIAFSRPLLTPWKMQSRRGI